MRAIADDWEIDELTVIREHREIIRHVCDRMTAPKNRAHKRLKVRPSLRGIAMQLRKKKVEPPFAKFSLTLTTGALLLFITLRLCAGHAAPSPNADVAREYAARTAIERPELPWRS
jgi:hypothetical protein